MCDSDRIDRRRFLSLGLGSSVGAGLGLGLGAGLGFAPQSFADKENNRPSIGLGFSLYGMKQLTIAQALRVCADLGYDGVELTLTPGFPAQPRLLSKAKRRELRDLLQSLDLRLPALMENLRLVADKEAHRGNLERLKAAAELGHDLAAKSPPVIETVLGGKPSQWEAARGAMVDRLGDWADVAEKTRTVLAVKAHVGGALHTPEDALWLVKQVDSPWVKLTYDFSHFQLRGFDLEKSLRLMIPHTAFIHVKDSAGDADHVRFLLPGEGKIDYVAYLKQLQSLGYQGMLVVEVSGQIHGRADYDPKAAASKSYRHLAAAYKKAGVRRS